ncbi:periplasmic component of amino acid ABC-type transporter/signal transduction system [Beggiatoa alba B18LD]|uniref:Periplasmic component of amino acid ABC-type transporter/signal transduction system n=1 Tax=Beggiatoa alba B18LD TaxID=395493 RepID=I3CFT1_9GAMM|nr:transporter substrate-binding domain-containing protein [Beggiatoa alba]EIJ42474.1 periplasmic component of amino acid ABC-type transporter/signal transduction system [Beggiatoa alba B18LD]
MKPTHLIIAVLLIIIAGMGFYQYHLSTQMTVTPTTTQLPKRVIIVTEASYPPFNMLNEKGEVEGFDIDLVKTLCERAHLECTVTAQSWDKIVTGLQTKQYDAIVNSMSITPDRKLFLAFSNPYQSNTLAFVVPIDSNIHKNNELKGKTIAVQKETVSAHYLEPAVNFGVLQVKVFEEQQAVWDSLIKHEVDAVLTDKLLAYTWLKTEAAKPFRFTDEFIVSEDKIGIAFRKEDTALIDKFNQALADVLKDGTYNKLNTKYFPFSIY